jgi:hypothetical protein
MKTKNELSCDDTDLRGIPEPGGKLLAVFPCESECANVSDTKPSDHVANSLSINADSAHATRS